MRRLIGLVLLATGGTACSVISGLDEYTLAEGSTGTAGAGGAGGQQPGTPVMISQDPPTDVVGPGNAYSGPLDTMGCIDLLFDAPGYTSIQRIVLRTALTSSFIGDLVIKLAHPNGSITTLLSRPGFEELVDDGTASAGDDSGLDRSAPIRFFNEAPNDAEQMGSDIASGIVCADDQRCSFFPNPGAGPGTDLDDFEGLDPHGTWRVCAGDAAGSSGVLIDWAELTITVQ